MLEPKINQRLLTGVVGGITRNIFVPLDFILYGEWLVPHTVKYKNEAYRKFYPFALFDVAEQSYLQYPVLAALASFLDLKTPQVFYAGPMQEMSFFEQFVGKSNMTEEEDQGEGIVILNEWNTIYSKYEESKYQRAKWVSSRHRELMQNPPPKVVNFSASQLWIINNVAEARIEKTIHKLNDEGILPSELSYKNFANIAKPVIEAVWLDVMEEEGDTLPDLFDENAAKKTLNKLVPVTVRKFIDDNQTDYADLYAA